MERKVFFNKNLKLLRKAHGLTLRELSDRTGISNSYLSQIENEKKDNVTLRTASKIALYFDVNFRDVCFREINKIETERIIIWADKA